MLIVNSKIKVIQWTVTPKSIMLSHPLRPLIWLLVAYWIAICQLQACIWRRRCETLVNQRAIHHPSLDGSQSALGRSPPVLKPGTSISTSTNQCWKYMANRNREHCRRLWPFVQQLSRYRPWSADFTQPVFVFELPEQTSLWSRSNFWNSLEFSMRTTTSLA